MGNVNENDIKEYSEVLNKLLLQSSRTGAKTSTLLDIQAQILARLEGRDLQQFERQY